MTVSYSIEYHTRSSKSKSLLGKISFKIDVAPNVEKHTPRVRVDVLE